MGARSSDPVRIAVIGSGRMACELASGAQDDPGLEVVGAWTATPGRAGGDLGELHGHAELGVAVLADPDSVATRDDVDAVIYTGLASPAETADILEAIAASGKDALTVGGLIHPEVALGRVRAEQLRATAEKGGTRVVGTGINPGFFLDVMPAIAAGLVARPDFIHARRVTDCGHWGVGVLDHELPVGREASADSGRDLGATLPESLALIVEGLGFDVDATRTDHEPLVARSTRTSHGRTVERGTLVGMRATAEAVRGDAVTVRLEWVAVFGLDPQVDGLSECATVTVEGEGVATLSCDGAMLVDGYPATAARALSTVRVLRGLPAGLYRPDQVPASPPTPGLGGG